jgi:hypothetical protein
MSSSAAQATVKWLLKYPSWSRKDPTKQTDGAKIVRIHFEGHVDGRVTWSIQPARMASAGSGQAVDTSALDLIEQALDQLRGRLEAEATVRRDQRQAAAGASVAAPPGPAAVGGDLGASE